MTDDKAEAFINGIELLRDGYGKALGCKYFKTFGGRLAEVNDDTAKKERVSSFGSPLLGGCGNEACRLMLWKSLHLHYSDEEDDHSSKDSTGNKAQGAEESEEGTVVGPKLFAFMLKELEPERYPNPEQAMYGQKMEAALARIKSEEPGRRSKLRRW
jgi:hypothetical protein